jgi:hypothetical protein
MRACGVAQLEHSHDSSPRDAAGAGRLVAGVLPLVCRLVGPRQML